VPACACPPNGWLAAFGMLALNAGHLLRTVTYGNPISSQSGSTSKEPAETVRMLERAAQCRIAWHT
jgi:hypothetical protein